MEVKIYRCSNKNYWYQKHIGEIFEVDDHYPDLTKYKVKGEIYTIDLEDTLEDLEYQSHTEYKEATETPAMEKYTELREFLQEHNAPPHLKQKLFMLYEDASFFD